MSNANKTAPSTGPTLEQWMRARHTQIANALLIGAAVCAALPIWQLVIQLRDKSGNVPFGIWALCLTLLLLFGGLYLKLSEAATGADERYRLLALGLGGMAGLFTFLLGIMLPLGPEPFGIWGKYFVPATSGPDTSVMKLWRENWWRIG